MNTHEKQVKEQGEIIDDIHDLLNFIQFDIGDKYISKLKKININHYIKSIKQKLDELKIVE